MKRRNQTDPQRKPPAPPTPKRPGPPPRYTVAEVAEALRKNGGLQTMSAKALGVNRATVCVMVARHPELRTVIEEAREATCDLAELKLIESIKKREAWAVCFFLKCQGKHRGYVERQELTGRDGQPLGKVNLEALSDADLATLAAIVEKAHGATP